jgi:hypothetical protein
MVKITIIVNNIFLSFSAFFEALWRVVWLVLLHGGVLAGLCRFFG